MSDLHRQHGYGLLAVLLYQRLFAHSSIASFSGFLESSMKIVSIISVKSHHRYDYSCNESCVCSFQAILKAGRVLYCNSFSDGKSSGFFPVIFRKKKYEKCLRRQICFWYGCSISPMAAFRFSEKNCSFSIILIKTSSVRFVL